METEKTSGKDTEKVIHSFTIKGTHWKENCLPSLNDVIAEATKHPKAYWRLKTSMERAVISAIRKDLKGYKATTRVRLYILWGEKNKGIKRDFDNITGGGMKIINDALVKSGVIKDDSPDYLLPTQSQFVYTKEPYIKVEIREE